jgi:PAS domain S-box-containing protein
MSTDSTKFLRFALDTALDAVYVCDETARIHYVNPSACKMLGYSFEELTAKTVFEIDPNLKQEFWDETLEPCRQTGGLTDIAGTHRRKDGHVIPIEVSFNIQYIDGVEYSCSICRDISDRKAAAREMERLRFAVENANDAVYLYDRDARIQYVNASACKELGCSYDELTSMSLSDIDPDFTVDRWPERWLRTKQGLRESMESVHRRKDGSTFPVEISFGAQQIKDDDYAIAFARNISERKETAGYLRLLELAIDNAGDGIYLTRADGDILYANNAVTQLLGYSKEELKRMKMGDVDPQYQQTDWTSETRWESLNDGPQVFQAMHRRKNGTLFPVEVAGVGMSFEGEQYGCGITRDITERLETERRLRFLEFAMDHSGDGVFITNARGSILYVNDAASRMLGYTKAELLRMSMDEIDPSLQNREWDSTEAWDRVNAEPIEQETMHRKKDGTLIPIDLVGAGLVFEGQQFGFGAARDISERKNTEEELARYRERLEELVENRTAELKATQQELVRKEKLAVLGQLTGTVAHELRNPLGTVRSSIYLIRDCVTQENPAIDRAIQRAERNIVRCDKLIDELLDFTRTRELELVTVKLDAWLKDVVHGYELPSGIELEFDLASDVQVDIDDERFRRCVINMLANACDAMTSDAKEKPKVLRVGTRREGDRAVIEIADTGARIPEDKLQKIFEPLFSTKAFGVGLGLPIIEQAVQQHHGGVWIVSTEGQRTSACLWLPRHGNG